MCGLYFLTFHTVNCWNPTVSIPLRNHKGCVELGSALNKNMDGWVKESKDEVEEKGMGLTRSVPRSTNLTTP